MVNRVCRRILVDDRYILQDQGGEWLEMNLFKCYHAVKFLRKALGDFLYGKGLHLWELYDQRTCQDDNSDGY